MLINDSLGQSNEPCADLPKSSTRPTTLISSPITPTTTSSFGSWIGSFSMNLLHASMVMLKQMATRKTAFTRAPNTSALAQPNVFFDHFFGDI